MYGYATESGKSKGTLVGEAGVGGGGLGVAYDEIGFMGEGVAEVDVVERDGHVLVVSSVSVSSPESSSSQESATGVDLCLGFG